MASLGIQTAMKDLLTSGHHSDLIISCGGKDFHVHRAVVCPQCPFLDRAVNGVSSEAQSERITLADDDPDAVERMISFLYTHDYNDEPPAQAKVATPPSKLSKGIAEGIPPAIEEGLDRCPAFNSLRVYKVANKYGIALLKDRARAKFFDWTHENWHRHIFPHIVRAGFEAIADDDDQYCGMVAELLIKNAVPLLYDQEVRKLIAEYEELGDIVMHQILDNNINLEAQAMKCKKEALRSRKEAEGFINDLLVVKSELDVITSTLTNLQRCRGCDVKFNVRFATNMGSNFTIICEGCRTAT